MLIWFAPPTAIMIAGLLACTMKTIGFKNISLCRLAFQALQLSMRGTTCASKPKCMHGIVHCCCAHVMHKAAYFMRTSAPSIVFLTLEMQTHVFAERVERWAGSNWTSFGDAHVYGAASLRDFLVDLLMSRGINAANAKSQVRAALKSVSRFP